MLRLLHASALSSGLRVARGKGEGWKEKVWRSSTEKQTKHRRNIGRGIEGVRTRRWATIAVRRSVFTATGAEKGDITINLKSFYIFLQVFTKNVLKIVLRDCRFPAVNAFYFVVGFSSKATIECKTFIRESLKFM